MGSIYIRSCSSFGLETTPIIVEADISSGLPSFKIVGLPDAAVSEAKERVRAAIKNSGFPFPRTRITINLAPADVKKHGPAYDLPIAISILLASGAIEQSASLDRSVLLGELALNGDIKPVKGALLAAICARDHDIPSVILANANAQEAGLIQNVHIHPVHSLRELALYTDEGKPLPVHIRSPYHVQQETPVDMQDIRGQEQAKRALEIAVAGGHNILLSGSPGSGKSMLAKAAPGILPPITIEESIEVTKIHSIAGFTSTKYPLKTTRPFRSPHHSSSNTSLIGGGTWPKPGEISLAHRGILFMDEFPEFERRTIENLRGPLEDGIVTIARAAGTLQFPAQFMLIAAMNPCPCGSLNDPKKPCVCTPTQVTKYARKISGPIADRIDLHIDVPRVDLKKLSSNHQAESSKTIRERVERAREIQASRYADMSEKTNAEVQTKNIQSNVLAEESAVNMLTKAAEQLHFSARGYTRTLKVARTIADLAECATVKEEHILEAVRYRKQENRI